ncbi:MAG: glycosyltransferase family 4 protein [Ilumatobacteraceae bacterium]
MSEPLRIAMVMPPTVIGDPKAAVATWTTLTRTIAEVHEVGDVSFHVFGRQHSGASTWTAGPDRYTFTATDRRLGKELALARPDVVHVHGLTHARQWRSVGAFVPRQVPVVMQHHGEPVPGLRARVVHRLGRPLDAYLFTGADHGQAQPFIDARMIRRRARLFEVLEAGSLLPEVTDALIPSIALEGSPAILWVGRLIASKQPLVALEAFRRYAASHPTAHLHVLATDRTMEAEVVAEVATLGPAAARVHVHDPVPHAQMSAWYRGADVYFSTSLHEGSNYSLIEAMTSGCAPAVSDIPSHRAITGAQISPFEADDPQAAALAIERAAALRRDDVRDDALQRLSWTAVATRLLQVWKCLRTQGV